jgi:phospholipase/carboxylesterase
MPLLVLLHGYGSNEDDLFGLAPYIDPRFAIVSARAPQVLGYGNYAWFPIEFDRDGVRVRQEDVRSAVATVVDFVSQAMAAYDAEPASTILAGFSQGATMAGAALLRQPGLADGGVLMSGFVTAEMAIGEVATSADGLRGKPVLITHGLLDPVVPITSGRASRDLFHALGADVSYREYSMAHEISEACLEDVDAWLTDRVAPPIAPTPD